MKAPAGVLDLPAERGTRQLVLAQLDHAGAAHERLARGDDDEALHDFRVALRRLRSTLRAYRDHLSASVRRKDRRRLRALAAATDAARDLQVHATWLARGRHGVDAHDPALHHLLGDMDAARERADEVVRREVLKGFPRERWRLARRLRFYRLEVDLDAPLASPPLASVLARSLVDHAAALEQSLAAVHTVADQERAHRARIEAKRLRYLLDPFASELTGAPELLRALKRLQDALGEMHDAHVLLERLGRVAAGADEADAAPDHAHLRAALEAERAAHFARVQRSWLQGRAEGFRSALRELAGAVARRGEPDREIERKYLLKRMPAIGRLQAEVLQVDQGYLPGERLAERVRRVRQEGSVRYYRTVKLGKGVSRIELEEETSEPVFRRLWPLTRGRRVRKTRYRVHENGFVWEVDRFRDRSLVLAEVELPTENTHAEPPVWLRRELVREVTGEDQYTNLNLAR